MHFKNFSLKDMFSKTEKGGEEEGQTLALFRMNVNPNITLWILNFLAKVCRRFRNISSSRYYTTLPLLRAFRNRIRKVNTVPVFIQLLIIMFDNFNGGFDFSKTYI